MFKVNVEVGDFEVTRFNGERCVGMRDSNDKITYFDLQISKTL